MELALVTVERRDPIVEVVADIDDKGRHGTRRQEVEEHSPGLIDFAGNRCLAQVRKIVSVGHDLPGLVVIVVAQATTNRQVVEGC